MHRSTIQFSGCKKCKEIAEQNYFLTRTRGRKEFLKFLELHITEPNYDDGCEYSFQPWGFSSPLYLSFEKPESVERSLLFDNKLYSSN